MIVNFSVSFSLSLFLTVNNSWYFFVLFLVGRVYTRERTCVWELLYRERKSTHWFLTRGGLIYAHLHNPIKFNYKSRFSDRRCLVLVLAFIAAAHIEQQQQQLLKSSHSVGGDNESWNYRPSQFDCTRTLYTHNVFVFVAEQVCLSIMKMLLVHAIIVVYRKWNCLLFWILSIAKRNKRQIMLVVLFASLFLFVFI